MKSAIIEFGGWITHHDWSEVFSEEDPDLKVRAYINTIEHQIDKFFPLKSTTLSNTDKPWITPEVKHKIALRQKAYLSGDFDTSNQLHKTIKKLCFKLRTNYKRNNIHLLKTVGPKNWFRQINSIINPDKCSHNKMNNIYELAGKDESTMTNIVNNFFNEIVCKYPPLDPNKLPAYLPHLKNKIQVSVVTTYKLVKKVSSKSPGPGDIPPRILTEFAPELATPICNIVNACMEKCIFPKLWKRAKIIPIPKSNQLKSLSDLRPISITPAPGKVLEKIICTELRKQLQPKLDLCQFGNVKGSSTNHYLIKLLEMAYASTDKGNATTAVTIDYSKAFDYIDHTILIDKLINLGVSAQIVKIITSFLSDRYHCTKIGNTTSDFKVISCGVPQGTLTGPFLFTAMINGDSDDVFTHLKFVDDKTIALNHSGDPTVALQDKLDTISKEAKENAMVINGKKCNVIHFNFSGKNSCPKNLHIDGNLIKRENSVKLLGVTITDDLKWTANTNNICKKVRSNFYKLSKLKSFGATRDDLVTAWTSILRPCAEYASPVWHSGLTECDNLNLEKLQKSVLAIILSKVYVDHKPYYKLDDKLLTYEEALHALGLESLYQRREGHLEKFAKSLLKSDAHRNILPEEKPSSNTRERWTYTDSDTPGIEKIVLTHPITKTDRYKQSAVPKMTRIINELKLPKPT